MSFLSCSVLGAAFCAIALTSAHRPLNSGSGFALFGRSALRYLAECHVSLSSASVTTPYKRHFCSRRARPAVANGVPVAGVLSFSPPAAPSTAVALTASSDTHALHCLAACPMSSATVAAPTREGFVLLFAHTPCNAWRRVLRW